jgi:hypothetical protein
MLSCCTSDSAGTCRTYADSPRTLYAELRMPAAGPKCVDKLHYPFYVSLLSAHATAGHMTSVLNCSDGGIALPDISS